MARFPNHCSAPSGKKETEDEKDRCMTIALAGNANVGKSVIFNKLSGSGQIIGNWPGKTVDMARGELSFEGRRIDIIDLPGIYSFSTYSLEELVSRDYITFEKPDVVINVVDASVLERNLYFTLQLMEMGVPLVICINQIDMAERKGISLDIERLQKILGVPVVSTVAIRGEGLHQLVEAAVAAALDKQIPDKTAIKYGTKVEERIDKLTEYIEKEGIEWHYPPRWTAIKLFESDSEIKKAIGSKSKAAIVLAENLANEIESIYREPCFSVINSERYALAGTIADRVQKQAETKTSISERLDRIVMHKVFGYVISASVIGGLLLWTFVIGNFLSGILSQAFGFFQQVDPRVSGSLVAILWNGAFGGIVAGFTLVIPFVIPFYMLLAIIEDSGILTRIAFMMDSFMHRIGLHGKSLIPLILGYGCNVPAIYTTRILETRRERLLASLAITFAPCSARTIVILGLVAVFVGVEWALTLYILNIAIIFIIGKIAFKALPGETTGLIMEIHSFRMPSLSVVVKQTWTHTKSIIYIVFPMYIIGSALIQALYISGILGSISEFMAPLTVTWLGLPVIAGVLLIFGTVRKEYILLLLIAIYGTNLASVLTPIQFIVLAFIGMLYIPCISTIAVLGKEFGWKSAIMISLANFITAIVFGGLFYRLLIHIM